MFARAALRGLVAATCLASAAQAGWQPPHTFASTPEPHDQSGVVAIDAARRATVAWNAFDGFSDAVWATAHVVRSLGSGVGWPPPRRLSEPLSNAHYPRVAVDNAGDAVVVWTVTYSEFDEVVQASIRVGPTGAWSQPEQISPAGEWGELAEVGFDDERNLTAVWANITHHQVQAATYDMSSQAWSEPQTISTGEMRSGPLLAVAPNGRAVAAWSVDVGNGNNVVRASVRPSRTGAWLPEHDLSAPDGYAAVDDIANDPSGQMIVMWDRFLATTDYAEVATLPAGSQEWSPPIALNSPGTSGHNGQVAFDGEGNAVAAWLRDIQLEHDGIDVSTRAAGGDSWSPAQPIAEHTQGPVLTVDAAGDAVVVYGEVNWFTTMKSRVRNSRTGLWGLPTKLAPPVIEAYPLTIESGPLGSAFALWQLHSDQCYCFTLQGADYIGRTP